MTVSARTPNPLARSRSSASSSACRATLISSLNLPAASAVVIMEPQYKPSTEWQAAGRAHRMGQTRPVIVRRRIARHSADGAIVKLSGFKAELFDQLARPSALADASPAARFPKWTAAGSFVRISNAWASRHLPRIPAGRGRSDPRQPRTESLTAGPYDQAVGQHI